MMARALRPLIAACVALCLVLVASELPAQSQVIAAISGSVTVTPVRVTLPVFWILKA